jgi:hypothetical protein
MMLVNGITISIAPSDIDGLNDSIGIMLYSYTHAINKQSHLTGKLIREKTTVDV